MRSTLKYAIAALALTCPACKTTQQAVVEPEVRVQEVKVATPVPCGALTALGPEPTYPDTDAAIAKAATLGQLAALYAKGRALRIERLSLYAIAKTSCLF